MSKKGSATSRLRELLGVLRKRDVLHGLTPVKLRQVLEDLGPTYVKLGQVMSLRSDMLPQEYCDELARLRTTVQPVPFEEVLQMLRQEYGRSPFQIFSQIDPNPRGSASIAQVYSAVVKDNGRKVVIKVQRPGIYHTMSQDIKLMHQAVRLLKRIGAATGALDIDAIIDEMWTVAQEEMNFLQEADHIEEFARLNRDILYVTCPAVDRHLTTARVMVMDRVEGVAIDNVDALQALGYDMDEIGRKLAENYTKQVLDDAFFHADPHPGNVWISGGQIVFLDLGMMGRLSQRDQRLFRNCIWAMVEGDAHTIAEALLTIGTAKRFIDHARLYADVDALLRKYADMRLSELNLGQAIQEVLALAEQHGIAMPSNITMLARGIMTLEAVIARCSPGVSLMQIARAHLSGEMLRDFDLQKELRHSLRDAYRSLRAGVSIPADLSDLLKMWLKGHAKLNLEMVGSAEPLQKIDAMVNKLVVCVIAASLLLGSSIICATDMQPKVFGLPLLGLAGYALAFVLCAILLWKIRKGDRNV